MDKLQDKFDATKFQPEDYDVWEDATRQEHFVMALAHLHKADITEEDEDHYTFEKMVAALEDFGNKMGVQCELCESNCGEYATTTDDSEGLVPLCRWCYEQCCIETANCEGEL